MIDRIKNLQPGQRWPEEGQHFVQCDTHQMGRLFVVWKEGKVAAKFLNQPKSAAEQIAELLGQ